MDTAARPSTPKPAPAYEGAALRRRADEIFEATSPYPGAGFRNHCKRLFRLTSMLMAKRRVEFDADLAYFIAMVHDLGIVSEQDQGHNYLERSRALFHRETASITLPATAEIIDECLLYNHRLLPVPNLSAPAECFRNAVKIEHSHGLLRYGLDRAEVKALFDEHPRDNFDRVLVDFTWRTIKREPLTIVHGIFF